MQQATKTPFATHTKKNDVNHIFFLKQLKNQ